MHPESHVQEKALKPREPSLPAGAYRLIHAVGLSDQTSEQLDTVLQLHADIRAGRIEAAPSHLRECVTRVLHSVGLSGLSDSQMNLFLRDCSEADF